MKPTRIDLTVVLISGERMNHPDVHEYSVITQENRLAMVQSGGRRTFYNWNHVVRVEAKETYPEQQS
jgi:hypothetical protein